MCAVYKPQLLQTAKKQKAIFQRLLLRFLIVIQNLNAEKSDFCRGGWGGSKLLQLFPFIFLKRHLCCTAKQYRNSIHLKSQWSGGKRQRVSLHANLTWSAIVQKAEWRGNNKTLRIWQRPMELPQNISIYSLHPEQFCLPLVSHSFLSCCGSCSALWLEPPARSPAILAYNAI